MVKDEFLEGVFGVVKRYKEGLNLQAGLEDIQDILGVKVFHVPWWVAKLTTSEGYRYLAYDYKGNIDPALTDTLNTTYDIAVVLEKKKPETVSTPSGDSQDIQKVDAQGQRGIPNEDIERTLGEQSAKTPEGARQSHTAGYGCNYVGGYPGWDSSVEGGRLVLEKQLGKSMIIFIAGSKQMIIPAEAVHNVLPTSTKTMLLTCVDPSGRTVSPVFGLSDDILMAVVNKISQFVYESRASTAAPLDLAKLVSSFLQANPGFWGTPWAGGSSVGIPGAGIAPSGMNVPEKLPPDLARAQFMILRLIRLGMGKPKDIAKYLSLDEKEVEKELGFMKANGYITKDNKLTIKALETLGG